MQTDGRLVEQVEYASESGADLRGETDALRLAAREGSGAALKVDIAQADAFEKVEPGANFLQQLASDFLFALVGLDLSEKGQAGECSP